jgi:hypothetical protein
MQIPKRSVGMLAAAVLLPAGLYAQSVISAKSGVIHLAQGSVFIGDQKVDQKFGTFPDIKENMQLRTEEGRAEVLLTPGIFLRVGEDSAIRMISNRLIDTRVEFLAGQAMLESDISYKDNKDTHVTLVFRDYNITIARHGLFELQSSPAQLKVYSGEIEVAHGGEKALLKEGRLLPLTGAMIAEKFDSKEGGSLYRWSQNRSDSISVANLSAAKTASDSGYIVPPGGSWFFNRFYGLYTYLPGSGMFSSPFGNLFYSPTAVYSNFYNPIRYYGLGTANVGTRTALIAPMPNMRSTTLAVANNSVPQASAPAARSSVAAPPASGGISLGSGRAGGHGH